MHDDTANPGFTGLRRHLLNHGVSPRHVARIVLELDDHLQDIRADAADLAETDAMRRLGDLRIIANQVIARPELKLWIYRYPRIARIYMPLAYLLLLPAAPLFAGAAHASLMVRWGASLVLGAALTAATLLVMQLSITLT